MVSLKAFRWVGGMHSEGGGADVDIEINRIKTQSQSVRDQLPPIGGLDGEARAIAAFDQCKCETLSRIPESFSP
jgi:hypothetical protein